MKSTSHPVAIVTGGSSGIGRAVAERLASESFHIVVADVREDPREGGLEGDGSTVETIEKNGGAALFASCDVTSASDVDALFETAASRWGRLDAVVNNAGVYHMGTAFHETGEDIFDRMVDVNVRGMWLVSKAAVRSFLAQGEGGNIITIASTAGLHGPPNQSAYNLAKAAQINLTLSIAGEYGKDGIRSNAVCPTYIRSALTRELFEDKHFADGFSNAIPSRRWGEVDDVAAMVSFLASDQSSLVQGSVMKVDGGETLCRWTL